MFSYHSSFLTLGLVAVIAEMETGALAFFLPSLFAFIQYCMHLFSPFDGKFEKAPVFSLHSILALEIRTEMVESGQKRQIKHKG